MLKLNFFHQKNLKYLHLKKTKPAFLSFTIEVTFISGEIDEVFNLKITLNNVEYKSSTYIPIAPIILANDFEPAKTDSLRKLNIDFEKNHTQIKILQMLNKKSK